MSKRPKLESRIVGMVEKELAMYDENTKFLIIKLLTQVMLDRNKVVSNAANRLEAEINKLYETGLVEK
jgi:16S rRNA A1518/A1519 N6-dimethyltransferase RsmA/KsgA/DIM1 with predicted DNA glycosylase/AP lyase activity